MVTSNIRENFMLPLCTPVFYVYFDFIKDLSLKNCWVHGGSMIDFRCYMCFSTLGDVFFIGKADATIV